MYCPQCRSEYRDGITACPDCSVALVSQLGPEDEVEYVDLVTVYTTSNQSQLLIAKSLLEDAGIEFYAKNEGIIELFAMGRVGYNPVIGPIELQVRPDDADAAQEILSAMDDADEDIPHNAEFEE